MLFRLRSLPRLHGFSRFIRAESLACALIAALSVALAAASLFIAAAHAEDSCAKILEGTGPQGITWTPGTHQIPITRPEDILPEDYLRSVQNAGYSLEVESNRTSVSIIARIKDQDRDPYFLTRFSISIGSNPEAVQIDNLRSEDPLAELHSGTTIKQNKFRKGLPNTVFKYARDRLDQVLIDGGFKTVEAKTYNDYLVSILYRRTNRMRPATELGQKIFDRLDRYYKISSTDFPKYAKVDNLNQFSWLLDKKRRPAYLAQKMEAFLAGRVPKSEYELIKSGGETVAVHFGKSLRDHQRTFFIYPMSDGSFRWLSLADLFADYSKDMTLVRAL